MVVACHICASACTLQYFIAQITMLRLQRFLECIAQQHTSGTINSLSANKTMYVTYSTVTVLTVTGPLIRSHPAEKQQQQYLNWSVKSWTWENRYHYLLLLEVDKSVTPICETAVNETAHCLHNSWYASEARWMRCFVNTVVSSFDGVQSDSTKQQ